VPLQTADSRVPTVAAPAAARRGRMTPIVPGDVLRIDQRQQLLRDCQGLVVRQRPQLPRADVGERPRPARAHCRAQARSWSVRVDIRHDRRPCSRRVRTGSRETLGRNERSVPRQYERRLPGGGGEPLLLAPLREAITVEEARGEPNLGSGSRPAPMIAGVTGGGAAVEHGQGRRGSCAGELSVTRA
jgi:hypothetical protein